MPEKIEVKEQKEYHPKCPHCDKVLSQIFFHKVRTVGMTGIGYLAVYSCPYCKVAIGTSANSG
ncbi:MAG: hypothetical protein R3E97_10475 [Candidatus Eisenbacteria bacterium]